MRRSNLSGQRGQALPLVLGIGALMVAAALLVGLVGTLEVARARAQTAADVGALAAARRVLGAPRRDRLDARERGRRAAGRVLGDEDVRVVDVTLPGEPGSGPVAVQVRVRVPGPLGLPVEAVARAGVVAAWPRVGDDPATTAAGGGYSGPLVHRDGKPMCPAVAAAFDAMDASARSEDIDLVVVSGFRSDAEQAVLFAANPDPRWVARPGESRHRDATELDISRGDGRAWPWLARNAERFGFRVRYSWEPWHVGHLPGCGGGGRAGAPAGLPEWVPVRYRALVAASAASAGVPPVLLAALLEAESGYDPRAVSPAGALGIAQFMPATAAGMGLRDPFDPDQAIPAAARLLGRHLAQFGDARLALAAYNAGPGAVRAHGGVPPFAETRAYIARILALAGDLPLGTPPGAWAGIGLVRAGDLLV